MTKEELKNWKCDLSILKDIIKTVYSVIPKIGGKEFPRKHVYLDINTCTSEEFFKANPNYDLENGTPLMRTKIPNTHIEVLPEFIVMYLKNIVCDNEYKRTRRYISRYAPTLNFNDLQEGDIYKLLRSIIAESMIHEFFHVNQYMAYTSFSKDKHFESIVEYPVYLEQLKFIYLHLPELVRMLNIIPVVSASFVICARYYEKRIFKKLDVDPYKYFYYSEYPEYATKIDMNQLRKAVANAVAYTDFYHKGGRYKRASLEYLLAREVVICDQHNDNFMDENYDNIGVLIRSMRINIRKADYFEYDNIVWKENGKYVYRIQSHKHEYEY